MGVLQVGLHNQPVNCLATTSQQNADLISVWVRSADSELNRESVAEGEEKNREGEDTVQWAQCERPNAHVAAPSGPAGLSPF